MDAESPSADPGSAAPLIWMPAVNGHVAGAFVPHGWGEYIAVPTVFIETCSLFQRREDRPGFWHITALNGEATYFEQDGSDEEYTKLRLVQCQWSWEITE